MRACRDYSTGRFLKYCAGVMAWIARHRSSLEAFPPGAFHFEPDNFSVSIFLPKCNGVKIDSVVKLLGSLSIMIGTETTRTKEKAGATVLIVDDSVENNWFDKRIYALWIFGSFWASDRSRRRGTDGPTARSSAGSNTCALHVQPRSTIASKGTTYAGYGSWQ